MASELQAFLDAVAVKIRTIDVFSGGVDPTKAVKVQAHQPGNISQQIESELLRGTGVLAIVAFASIVRPKTNTKRPTYDPLKFYVRVAENAFLNKTRPHVLELAERVDAELRYWTPAIAGGNLIAPDGEMQPLNIVPSTKPEDAGKLNMDGWDIPFVTKFAPTPAG